MDETTLTVLIIVALFITMVIVIAIHQRNSGRRPLRRVWIQRTDEDGKITYTIMPSDFNPAGQGNGGNVTYHNCMLYSGGFVYMESENQYVEPCNF